MSTSIYSTCMCLTCTIVYTFILQITTPSNNYCHPWWPYQNAFNSTSEGSFPIRMPLSSQHLICKIAAKPWELWCLAPQKAPPWGMSCFNEGNFFVATLPAAWQKGMVVKVFWLGKRLDIFWHALQLHFQIESRNMGWCSMVVGEKMMFEDLNPINVLLAKDVTLTMSLIRV